MSHILLNDDDPFPLPTIDSGQYAETLKNIEHLLKTLFQAHWLLQPSAQRMERAAVFPPDWSPLQILMTLNDHLVALVQVSNRLHHDLIDQSLHYQLDPLFEAALTTLVPVTEVITDFSTNQAIDRAIWTLNQALQMFYTKFAAALQSGCYDKPLRNARKNRRSLTDYLNHLLDQYAKLLVVRIDLSYQSGSPCQRSYVMAKQHRLDFFKVRRWHPAFNYCLGYAWKLEYGLDRGFHYHVLLLYDGSQIKSDVAMAHALGQHWQMITQSNGIYYNCNHAALERYQHHPHNALGQVRYHDTVKLQALTQVIHYLTKPNRYIQILPQNPERFFGRSCCIQRAHPQVGRPRHYPRVVIPTDWPTETLFEWCDLDEGDDGGITTDV